jgi:hypothetical protein
MICLSKSKTKPEKASSSSKNEKEGKKPHVCGAINGVMGKGAFTREGKKLLCVECGKAYDKYPEGYLEAKKKLNPKTASLLEKGSKYKTTGKEHEKWSKAGDKAWETRKKNKAAKEAAKKPSKGASHRT